MAVILLIGSDTALLEGLTQSLAAAGHGVDIAHELRDAFDVASTRQPLVVVAERDLAQAEPAISRLAAPGGALVLYHTAAKSATTLSATMQRAAMADLTLPLE